MTKLKEFLRTPFGISIYWGLKTAFCGAIAVFLLWLGSLFGYAGFIIVVIFLMSTFARYLYYLDFGE